IGGGVDAWTPIRARSAAAGADVFPLLAGERGGFFDADDVVFEAEKGIDFILVLIMAGEDARAVGEEDDAFGEQTVGEAGEEAAADIGEAFAIGFAGFAQEEAFETGTALAIV